MAVVTHFYAEGVNAVFTKTVDPLADTIKMALVDSSYTPDYDTDDFWVIPEANEITGTGYSAGGVTVGSKTFTYNSGTGLWTFSTTVDPSWATATVTFRYAILYKSTGTDSTSPLLTCADFGSDQSAVAELLTLHVPTAGFFEIARTTG